MRVAGRFGSWPRWVWLSVGAMVALVGVYVAAVYWPDPHLVRTLSTSTAVNQVTFSPDGQFLASGGDDGQLILWRGADGQRVQSFGVHDKSIRSVAFSPDGHLLASAGQGHDIQLWRVNDGQLIRTLLRPPQTFDWTYAVAFSPDGTLLTSGGTEGKIYLWQVSSGKLVRTLQGHLSNDHHQPVGEVVFSPDGQLLATGALDGIVHLWRVADGQLLGRLENRPTNDASYYIRSLAFSPDGTTLAVGRLDTTIQRWSVGDGRLQKTFGEPQTQVWSVAFSPDGHLLASGGGPGPYPFAEFPFAWPDKLDTRIRIWRVADQQPVMVLKGDSKTVYSIVFSPDGRILVSGGEGGKIRLWRVQ